MANIFTVQLVNGTRINVASATDNSATPVAIVNLQTLASKLANNGTVLLTDENGMQFMVTGFNVLLAEPFGQETSNLYTNGSPKTVL